MESAKQEVKDVADFITKSNNNDEFAFEQENLYQKNMITSNLNNHNNNNN